jgi:hypothetical protein
VHTTLHGDGMRVLILICAVLANAVLLAQADAYAAMCLIVKDAHLDIDEWVTFYHRVRGVSPGSRDVLSV